VRKAITNPSSHADETEDKMNEDLQKAEAYWANLRGQVEMTFEIAKVNDSPCVRKLITELAQVLQQAVNQLGG
jgi:hypothetical protein